MTNTTLEGHRPRGAGGAGCAGLGLCGTSLDPSARRGRRRLRTPWSVGGVDGQAGCRPVPARAACRRGRPGPRRRSSTRCRTLSDGSRPSCPWAPTPARARLDLGGHRGGGVPDRLRRALLPGDQRRSDGRAGRSQPARQAGHQHRVGDGAALMRLDRPVVVVVPAPRVGDAAEEKGAADHRGERSTGDARGRSAPRPTGSRHGRTEHVVPITGIRCRAIAEDRAVAWIRSPSDRGGGQHPAPCAVAEMAGLHTSAGLARQVLHRRSATWSRRCSMRPVVTTAGPHGEEPRLKSYRCA